MGCGIHELMKKGENANANATRCGVRREPESPNELENAIYKLRLIGFKDEAALLENSAHSAIF